jgi:hypothetical protein
MKSTRENPTPTSDNDKRRRAEREGMKYFKKENEVIEKI